ARLDLEIWRDDDFAENFADHFCHRLVQRPVADDNPAKWRLLVSRECLLPRLAQIWIRADAAGVCMLQDRDGRLFKFGDQIGRGANVEKVVQRKLLTLKF